jgi:radical SAM protein with 4Fe4S-binding SPASM domain
MEHILIISNNNLLPRLKGKSIVMETDNFEIITQIKNDVLINNNLYGYNLFCIIIHSTQDIASIEFKEEWENIPIVVYASELGKVRDLINKLPLIEKLNIKFFLHPETEQNYSGIQILSSLGIYSGIVINENADWEKLEDLMYYALLGRATHAPIEPFQYVYDLYVDNAMVDYGTVYFNNPSRFLYVDESGKIAFSKNDLQTQSFFLNDISELANLEKNVLYKQKIKTWQSFFYEPTQCASCAAWRICLGKFVSLEEKQCQSFIEEWLDILRLVKKENE